MACDPEELCEECPEWIFTLADLLMCMMGLFVILWVLKPEASDDPAEVTREQIRQQELIRDIQMAFGAEADPERALTIEELKQKLEQIKRNGEGEKGTATQETKGAEGTDPEVMRIRDGDLSGVGGRVTFATGASHLGDDERRALDQIAAKIRGHRNIVLVKGHTAPDDLPDAGEAREQHLDLSLARAAAVVDYLVEQGVTPEILRVQGCGSYEPVRRRAYDEADRRTNRRVEVEATDQLVGARAVSADPTVPSPAPPANAGPGTPAIQN